MRYGPGFVAEYAESIGKPVVLFDQGCERAITNFPEIEHSCGEPQKLCERNVGFGRFERGGRIIQFLNKQAAGAFHQGLCRIDAGVTIVGEFALQRIQRLLEHRRMSPMRTKGLYAGIPIRAHVRLLDDLVSVTNTDFSGHELGQKEIAALGKGLTFANIRDNPRGQETNGTFESLGYLHR